MPLPVEMNEVAKVLRVATEPCAHVRQRYVMVARDSADDRVEPFRRRDPTVWRELEVVRYEELLYRRGQVSTILLAVARRKRTKDSLRPDRARRVQNLHQLVFELLLGGRIQLVCHRTIKGNWYCQEATNQAVG